MREGLLSGAVPLPDKAISLFDDSPHDSPVQDVEPVVGQSLRSTDGG